MSAPRFSIVIPCYNQAQYLPESVASVVQQSLSDWELIIVDDGSPDQTAQIAQALIAAYPDRELRLVQQVNTGLAGARNAGIRVAHGDLIVALDADDCLEPTILERTLAVFDTRPDVGFVYGDTRLFGDVTGLIVNRPFSTERLCYSCLLHSMYPFRRRAWEQVGGYRDTMGRGYQDWNFWLSLAGAGWQGYYLHEVLAAYRRTASSMHTRDLPYDLELRALLVANHLSLYPKPFQRWSKTVRSAAWSEGDLLRTQRWLWAFLWYNLLIAWYAPRDLPRMLLRPLYWHLPQEAQQVVRRVARVVLR